MKLNAYVSHAGVCSRRKAAELIKGGSVSVNKKVLLDPSYDVRQQDKVTVFGRQLHVEQKTISCSTSPRAM